MRQLANRGRRVSLFSLALPGDVSEQDRRALAETCDHLVLEEFAPSSAERALRLAKNVALGRAFHSDFFLSHGALARFRAGLEREQFDVIVVGQLYMYPYLSPDLHRVAVLDALNVESRRVAAIASTGPATARGLVARLQRRAIERFEREAVERIARTIAVSAQEQRHFEEIAPGRVDLVPNGVDCARYRPRTEPARGARLLFVGSLDYSANVDAVKHMLREVLPRMKRTDATVQLVGSHPRRPVFREAKAAAGKVEVAGHVEDVRPYFQGCRAFVVPLRFGGGTRLKILEALAQGVPVVSTSVGCEGLDLSPGRDLLVADHPDEFAAYVDRLLEDDELCRELGQHGRATVEAHYDWSRIADEFERSLANVSGRG
jgi:glycosyltransferase involved in cell wall biosynthesis